MIAYTFPSKNKSGPPRLRARRPLNSLPARRPASGSLGGAALRVGFLGLWAVAPIRGDLKVHRIAGNRAFVLRNHVSVRSGTGYIEGNGIAVHLAVGDRHRRRSRRSPTGSVPTRTARTAATGTAHTAAAHRLENRAGQLCAIDLKVKSRHAGSATVAALLRHRPLARNGIRRHASAQPGL